MRHRALVITSATCCVVAAIISHKLLLTHFEGSSGSRWFDAGCAVEGVSGAGADCSAVLESPHSYFPPKYPDSYSEAWHVPVAFLGLLYYTVLLVWIIGVGVPTYRRRWVHLVPLAFVEIGIPASVYYTYVMFRYGDAWCPWCLATHGLNIAIAVCLGLMWPRLAAHAAGGDASVTATPSERARECSAGLPSWRAVGLTVGVMALVAFADTGLLRSVQLKRELADAERGSAVLDKAVKRLTETSERLMAIWDSTPQCDLETRSDDPLRTWDAGAPDALEPLHVVIFSDLGCSSCARFARLLDRRIQSMFDGHLAVVFKHYPLDRACNADLRARCDCPDPPPHTCEVARLAEAVRMVGGNAAFWTAHDFLHRHQEEIERGDITPARLGDLLGMDASAIAAAAESETAKRRIAEDVRQAGRCDIRMTPAVFIDGKLVDPVMMLDLRFWRGIARRYRANHGLPPIDPTHQHNTLQPMPG